MKLAFIAAAAASLFLSSAANAMPFQTNGVVPQVTYQTSTYTIAAGKTFKSLLIPAANRPIHFMAACTTPGIRGVGSVTLVRESATGNSLLQWSGVDYTNGVENGFSASAGTHIMYADFIKDVDVQANSADSIRIVNNYTSPVTVVVTLMY